MSVSLLASYANTIHNMQQSLILSTLKLCCESIGSLEVKA